MKPKRTDPSFNIDDLIELGLVATITVCLITRISQLT